MLVRVLPVFALALVAAVGCGGEGDVGSEPTGARSQTVDCAAAVATQRADWEEALERGVAEDGETEFPNLSREEFDARLAQAEDELGFRVIDEDWLEPLQAAPSLVLEWPTEPEAPGEPPAGLADGLDTVLGSLDPLEGDTRAFEGFFLEVRDREGLPLVALAFQSRGSDRGGSRFTRFGELVLRPPPLAPDPDVVCA